MDLAAVTCSAELCASARLLISLVNTRASGNGRTESLSTAPELSAWLATAGLGGSRPAVTPADAVAARELREAFMTVLASHCGCGDPPVAAAEAYLADIAVRYPLVPRVTAAGCTFVPAQTGVPGAFGALFAAAADLSAQGLWSRLKACKNPTCHAAFLDKTRNCSGQYCSTSCGSQVSMRLYRSRQKSG